MTTSQFEVQEEKRDRRGRQITPLARRVALVEGYRASGMTMEQYAKTEGVKRHTLAKWVYLHDQRAAGATTPASASFAQVKVVAAPRPAWAYEVVLPNGWVVRAADAPAVAQLLGVVHP
jgi:transposase-like protein